MDNEVTEIAKATQEVAKTARSGIEAAQGFGAFLARVLGEPIETAVGMVSDKLKFMRFERAIRLANRYNEIRAQRGLNSSEQPVPPKIALPAIEQASLEENDDLQDLWANLLTSAHDPSLNNVVRSAFVDILKQMEIVDVHVLNFVYSDILKRNIPHAEEWKTKHRRDVCLDPVKYSVRGYNVRQALGIPDSVYERSVDNLVRVRCLALYVEEVDIPGDDSGEVASLVHDYEQITITSLGWSFVRACTMPNMKPSGSPGGA